MIQINAIKGIQAQNTYFIANFTLKDFVEIFEFPSENDNPDDKYQRELNVARAGKFSQYLLDNFKQRLPYVIPSITASITACEYDEPSGILTIPDGSRLIINDGQHRQAGIRDAITKNSELGYDTVAIMLILDSKLKRSRQIFADINYNSKPVTKSLSILFNERDGDCDFTQAIINNVPLFSRYVEIEKGTVTASNTKLFTYSQLHKNIQTIFNALQAKRPDSSRYKKLVAHYWNCIASIISPFECLLDKTLEVKILKQNYIASSRLVLEAFSLIGAELLTYHIDYKIPDTMEDSKIYQDLAVIGTFGEFAVDWSKDVPEYQGTILNNGKYLKTVEAKRRITNYLSEKILGESIVKNKEPKAKKSVQLPILLETNGKGNVDKVPVTIG